MSTVGVLGWFDTIRSRHATLRYERSVSEQMPLATEMIAMAVSAGASLPQAIRVASEWINDPCAAELNAILELGAAGTTIADACALRARSCAALAPLGECLHTSARLGTPVVATLRRLAERSRAQIARRNMVRARTMSVRLIFPLVLLVLPAFVLLTVAPAVFEGWRGV